MMKRILVLIATIGFVSACSATFEERYKAGERELDSLGMEKSSAKQEERSTSAFSSYDSGKSIQSVAVLPPPSVIVVPEKGSDGVSELEIIKKNPYSRLMMESIGNYFAKSNYDLKTLDGEQKLNEFIAMQNDIAGNEDDLAYMASLFIGADVYIKYAGDFSRKNLRIDLKAYESVSGVLLGNVSENKKIDAYKNLEECIQSTAESASRSLESKIQNFRKNESQNGVQYKVIMNISSEFDEDFVENLHEVISKQLPGLFKSIKFRAMTDKTVDMTVFATPATYANSQEVYKAIRTQLKKIVGVKKTNITRKLIMLELKGRD